jgi:hypothetical protein
LVFAVSGESYLIGRVHRNGNESPQKSPLLLGAMSHIMKPSQLTQDLGLKDP